MISLFILLGSLSGGISVALGAFGTHALKGRLQARQLETFETGVRYQLFHALALLFTGLIALQWTGSSLPDLAGWMFSIGTLLFSGSLYALVLTGRRWLGAVTPFGGLALITGWACLGLAALGR